MEIAKSSNENDELQKTLDDEQEKSRKLAMIAEEKYKMNLNYLDNYMPKDNSYVEKLKLLEKKKIQEALKEKREIRGAQRMK